MKKITITLLMLMVAVTGFAQYPRATFQVQQSIGTRDIPIGRQLSQNEQITLADMPPIYALSVSGSVNFTSPSGYVSVLLVDELGHEYMVYESYPLLTESNSFDVDHMAFETAVLAGVKGKSVKVNVRDCLFNLQSLTADYSNQSTYARTASVVRAEQAKVLVDQLNHNLEKQQYAWRARVTAVSKLPYEQKKQMMGLDLSRLPGFEYYSGGIYCTPDVLRGEIQAAHNDTVLCKFADIDWRNVHGKNWMTPAKFQTAQVCWVFGAIGGVESYINRYYNQILDLDLSEQDVFISIKGRVIPEDKKKKNRFWHGNVSKALSMIKLQGVVEEDCFPYTIPQLDTYPCANPQELIKITKYTAKSYSYSLKDDAFMRELLSAPMIVDFQQSNLYDSENDSLIVGRHTVVLAGKRTLRAGDEISLSPMNDKDPIMIVLHDQSSLIGRSALIFKNSYGADWGDNGYCYMLEDDDTYVYCSYSIKGKVQSKQLTDNDIRCVDEDGDGYYTWGVSEIPPSTLPQWAFKEQDGNDANPRKGPMDQWGYCQDISLSGQIFTKSENRKEQLGYQSNLDLLQSFPTDKYQADVFDKVGRKVCSFEVSSRADLITKLQKQLSAGVYLVNLIAQGRVYSCEKVVIK